MVTRRLAVVTGTSSGIGERVASQLLERGWHVFGIARRATAIKSTQYTHLRFDLRNVAQLPPLLDTNLDSQVRAADVSRVALVNNAGDVALLGQVEQLKPEGLLEAYAVNTVAPVLLMGWLLRTVPPSVPIRILNVSSGAGVEPFPGLAAYGATKAALRMAGMVLAAELDMHAEAGHVRDATILSYEPGVVETPMQTAVRESTPEIVPIVHVFQQFAAEGRLRPAHLPAAEIVRYLEADGHPRFREQRFLL